VQASGGCSKAVFVSLDQEAREIQTPSDPVRVLHVTDPHLFADEHSSLRGTVTHATLSAVIDDIGKRAWPADLVAMTGDLIQDDTAAAYDRFVELMGTLAMPVYCVPGNHDVRSLMQQALASPPFHYCASVTMGDWLITGIDSCIDGDAAGRVSDEELERLEKILATTEAMHVLVCLHHPPLPVGTKWLDQVGLRNGDDFLNVIGSAGNVRLALFGHVHQQFDQYSGSVRIIGTPSTCRQFEQGSEHFALDDRPPAYRQISLHADGDIDTELIWLTTDE